MAFVLADRVKETTTTTGTGTITLAGASAGYQSFSVIGNANTTYYAIIDNTTGDWEVGLGTYTSSGTTLARTKVISNSLGTTALISFAAGSKDVICTQPASPTGSSGNTVLGYNAGAGGSSITSTGNILLGYNAGKAITSGQENICIGYNAGPALVSASQNILIGTDTGTNTTATAQYNTFIGWRAGYNLSTGLNNVSVGSYASGNAITSGSYNVILGNYTGTGGDISVTSTSNNVVISDGNGGIKMYWGPSGVGSFKAAIQEQATVSATAATGTINYDAATQSVLYYTANATANFTMNFRASSTVTMDSAMQTGKSLTVAFLNTNGATAYYPNAFQVDGVSVTPKWQGGTAPSSGNASAIDAYVFTLIKTGSATYTVLASQTKFA